MTKYFLVKKDLETGREVVIDLMSYSSEKEAFERCRLLNHAGYPSYLYWVVEMA